MDNFSFYIPTRFEFGDGAEQKAGEMIRALGGTKVLVHFGGGSAVKSGLIGRVTESLDAAGLAHPLLGGALPNPRDDKVMRASSWGAGSARTSFWRWAAQRH
jgi:alcohol dehydrogenase YqhD (iron-dependent ADH family)